MKVRSADGTQHFALYETVLAGAQTPTDPTILTSSSKVVELIEVMAVAALENARPKDRHLRQAVQPG
eukprot:5563862-Pleurochrysis_carterae.AAC.1